MSRTDEMDADVCVVGGGPAGLMLGLLLARAGVRTVVLEKHADFLRDFRGDTVHPSTLALIAELGLAERAEALPHRKVDRVSLTFADGTRRIGDLRRLRGWPPYIMFVPQWDFLEMLATEAARYDTFTLLRETEMTALDRDPDGTVRGVRARTSGRGSLHVRAALTVACDGRSSTVRRELGLSPVEFGAPMDVLWFRMPRLDTDPEGVQGLVGAGGALISIDRGSYWQIAYLIPKGGYGTVVAQGLDAFRTRVVSLFPALADRIGQITSFDDVHTLTVQVDRLRRWHVPGALLIGDAAHAMSPIGGVGINLAIQDAVATARLLAPALREGRLTRADLAAVQRRRMLPTRIVQGVQRVMQRALIAPLLRTEKPVRAPLPLRVLDRFPVLQGIPARVIGVGPRPERPPARTGAERYPARS
ncbi:FAD-dependent oxidoreductase [Catenuloplanes niger JCM 9533]|uniref:2-polyprenyl-6-methoxyphenol hydroxylase-like FAD-dependent oxidoreductase n=2 Tax=Micromonosporaceae TaxID=28056 RepID=A0AAE4CR97_9ACTN|nr:2-polyprenyl-6-methoxyphenol hydroxylase-like FAD-dependent oxidoreductase [Catenuloplanes niger]